MITPDKRARAIKDAGGKDQYILALEQAALRLFRIVERVAPDQLPDTPVPALVKTEASA